MKFRFSAILFSVVLILALFGLTTSLIRNPSGFFLNIAIFVGVAVIIWFVFRQFRLSSPQNKEQKAFVKAAKQSKKRLQTKEKSNTKQPGSNRTSSLKAQKFKRSKSTAHLTVIDGRKSKKKNRASL
ncbi:MAG TPA: SA1362 family protein [Niallia sp.]|nr:SA1362 family protein [Niallia sp.]